jgi:hypothetical protein
METWTASSARHAAAGTDTMTEAKSSQMNLLCVMNISMQGLSLSVVSRHIVLE